MKYNDSVHIINDIAMPNPKIIKCLKNRKVGKLKE